jgi:hypothetical protein
MLPEAASWSPRLVSISGGSGRRSGAAGYRTVRTSSFHGAVDHRRVDDDQQWTSPHCRDDRSRRQCSTPASAAEHLRIGTIGAAVEISDRTTAMPLEQTPGRRPSHRSVGQAAVVHNRAVSASGLSPLQPRGWRCCFGRSPGRSRSQKSAGSGGDIAGGSWMQKPALSVNFPSRAERVWAIARAPRLGRLT